MNNIFFWIKNARYKSLPQSLCPAILSVCLASKIEGFSFLIGLLSILGVIIGHLGVNLFDDYFDYVFMKSSFREDMARKGFRTRTLKCYYISSGQTNLKTLFLISSFFCFLALCIGVFIICYYRSVFILYLTLITGILSIFYSAPPLRLSYKGLGELLIGIIFGPLLMAGVYYASCGEINFLVIFFSIPIGLLVFNIVYIHSIMDFEPDKKTKKITLAILLKKKQLMLFVVFILLFMPFSCIFIGIVIGYLSVYYLGVFFTLPMAFSLFRLMIQFVYFPWKNCSPSPWMGPMGKWDQIKEIGLDWFLIRWVLARNLLIVFCIIIILICLIF